MSAADIAPGLSNAAPVEVAREAAVRARAQVEFIQCSRHLVPADRRGIDKARYYMDAVIQMLNEMTGAGIPSATTSQTPASVSPLEVA
jgi:hypothetical protein